MKPVTKLYSQRKIIKYVQKVQKNNNAILFQITKKEQHYFSTD